MAQTFSASSLLREENPSEGGAFSVRVEVVNPEVLQRWLEMGDDFEKMGVRAYNKFIFEVHKYLIRVTPIDTGELRGGWTSWLDANQQGYSRQIVDIALAIKAEGRDYHISPEGIEAGRKMSEFSAPTPTDITIINNVPYGFYLEAGTSRIPAQNFVEKAKFKAEFLFGQYFDTWFDKIAKASDIVEADEPQEIAA